MASNSRQARPDLKSLADPYAAVKSQIIAAGIRLGDLARAAGITPSALTLYLQGKLRCPRRQRDILVAFRALSESQIAAPDFWGKLLSERMAG